MSDQVPRTDDHVGDHVDDTQDDALTVHEERATYDTEAEETGRVRLRKVVDTYPAEETVSRQIEQADTSERVAATADDSGEVETLPDGSISVPVFEEVLEVTKRLVVRERVIVRKSTVVDEHVLRTELRRERVEIDAEGDIDVEDRRATTSRTDLPD